MFTLQLTKNRAGFIPALLIIVITLFSCDSFTGDYLLDLNEDLELNSRSFKPIDGSTLFIVGQENSGINSYLGNVSDSTAGYALYTSISRLEGLNNSSYNMGIITDFTEYDFSGKCLVIGLYCVGIESQVNNSTTYDSNISTLAQYIKDLSIPVFLRIGYEFDGDWNHYEPDDYIGMYQKIVEIFTDEGVNNCSFVWQSAAYGYTYSGYSYDSWYPGDDYVDWVGLSYFKNDTTSENARDAIMSIAKRNGKPVMICESTPQGYQLDELTVAETITSNPVKETLSGEDIWEEWFDPFFTFINENQDYVKGVVYINSDWDSTLMWNRYSSVGYWGDSRLSENDYILDKWKDEIYNTDYWKSSLSIGFSDLEGGNEVF